MIDVPFIGQNVAVAETWTLYAEVPDHYAQDRLCRCIVQFSAMCFPSSAYPSQSRDAGQVCRFDCAGFSIYEKRVSKASVVN